MENNNIDVRDANFSTIPGMNEYVAVAGKPVYGLRDCLNRHKKERLSELARTLNIPKHYSMKKPELVDVLTEVLADASRLSSILTAIDEAEFLLFEAAAENDITFTVSEHKPFHVLHLFGIATAFLNNGVITVIVPDEMKAVWAQLHATGFAGEKLRGEMIRKYAAAAVNLYGVISFDALISLIKRLEDVTFDTETVESALLTHMERYLIWDYSYVVNTVFGQDAESLEQLLELATDAPRYVPEKETFLEYISPIYYEDTPQNNAMAAQLGEVVGDENLAGILTGDLRTLFAAGISDDGCYSMLRESGLTGTSKEMTELMMNMRLGTRLWETRGFTYGGAPKKSELGRNEKCPCGSGLKHKKCCAGR